MGDIQTRGSSMFTYRNRGSGGSPLVRGRRCYSATANPLDTASIWLYQHLNRLWVAEELGRTSCEPVGSGLEHHDQIVDLGCGERSLVG